MSELAAILTCVPCCFIVHESEFLFAGNFTGKPYDLRRHISGFIPCDNHRVVHLFLLQIKQIKYINIGPTGLDVFLS